MKFHLRLLCALALPAVVFAQRAPTVTSPKEFFGFNVGDDYQVINYSKQVEYWKKLAAQSDRMRLVDIGKTAEGRTQYMAIVTSPANLKALDKYKQISEKLAHAEGVTEAQARQLAHDGKSIVWIDGGLHASESVGSQQLIETVYQLVSANDPEMLRLLNDDIVLCVEANPDGQEMVADWYMRETDPMKRSLDRLPKLYNKYIGHDDNRDFYMSNMPETTNMNRQMFREWFPQIVYDHHQSGPAGAVIFMPPFRDPFNFNLDPLIPLGIELVGSAMHSRLVAEGKGGSAMRSGSNYSTWWNGGLRTIAYFHNSIGLLTEIIGNPTPIEIPLVPGKQLPSGDWPLPIAPGKWHYRQSIDYDVTNNRAVLDIASRYRETFLFDSWRMGMNSIEKGNRDTWTITPKRIDALEAAARETAPAEAGGRGNGGGRGGSGANGGGGGRGAGGVPEGLYETVLHDPKLRDPRGYILPASQADFPTATKFVNALIKNGVTVMKANAAFTANGKRYDAGSYVVKTAQAFRPHVLDMFEPQDHPNDFKVPGGPPTTPYDITGWTLAMQMGVEFDRILDPFDGPFVKLTDVLAPAPMRITGVEHPAGYLVSHRANDSFILTNRLLAAKCEVYWIAQGHSSEGEALGTGAIWVTDSPAARTILDTAAKTLGVRVHGEQQRPAGNAMKLAPVRVGLYDAYGGIAPAGWTRWLLEQYEFPFEVVYPATLDAGDLKKHFDVLLLTDGAFPGSNGSMPQRPQELPTEYRERVGRITREKTLPQLKSFLEAGGSVIAIGSSARIGEQLGLPVHSSLVEKAADGSERPLPSEKFYIPGSLLRVEVDNTNPLAYGMPEQLDVFFDNSPVFKLTGTANVKAVAQFSGKETLDSGWAWGQQYLDGGVAMVDGTVGEGKLILLGPEVAFRAQPHGTFKFLFNAIYYGSARDAK